MEKNWLIRTKSNHILGPVSKEKLMELFHSGSIKGDDEVCSGNGFWFFIREEEMVEKYLFNEDVQTFNPISEAKDVLTSTAGKPMDERTRDDITVVGGINLLNNTEPAQPRVTNKEENNPSRQNVADEKKSPAGTSDVKVSIATTEKKKTNSRRITKSNTPRPSRKKFKKQGYLRYIVYLAFIILFFLIYFRKAIIRQFFEGEINFSGISLISPAMAQESLTEKKKLLNRVLIFDEVTFSPLVGLGGFRVTGQVDIQNLSCDELANAVYQLAIILHPTEAFNEKFLVKMSNCVTGLTEDHPVKRWFRWASDNRPSDGKNQLVRNFLTEMINSPFNLITDSQVKIRIVEIISDVPEDSIAEKLLKAYLYLMIGNITRADNILLSVVKQPPYKNWQGYHSSRSIYHQLATDNAERIFDKFSRHPTDRRIFELFCRYLQSFYNDDNLLQIVQKNIPSLLQDKLYLEHTEKIAPRFVNFLRLSNAPDALRFQLMRNLGSFPLRDQAYWLWPFFDINPLVTDAFMDELSYMDKHDELWFIYVMDHERLADLYIKNTGKSFLPTRRQQLRKMLLNQQHFMLALYKLIEFGDIDQSLVQETIRFLINE